jgi:hypothetical protein
VDLRLGDLPEWLAAIGTVGALFTGLFQIRREQRLRVASEDADRAERRRSQAQLISAWSGRETPVQPTDSERDFDVLTGSTTIHLLNGSREPAYSVVVCIVWIQGTGPHTAEEMIRTRTERDEYGRGPWTTLGTLPPGRWRVSNSGTGWAAGLGGRPGAEVSFTDRAGVHWIRRSAGRLEELPQSPLDHFGSFGLHGPYDFQIPEAD